LEYVRVILRSDSISGPEDNLMIERLLHWNQDSNGRLELRLLDDLAELGHLRLIKDGTAYLCAEANLDSDVLDLEEPIQWYTPNEQYAASDLFAAKWGQATNLKAPDYETSETVLKVDIKKDQACEEGFMVNQCNLIDMLQNRTIKSILYSDRYLLGPVNYRNLLDTLRHLPLSKKAILTLIVHERTAGSQNARTELVTNSSDVDKIYRHSYADFENAELPHVINYLVDETELLCADLLIVPRSQKHWIKHARRMILGLDDDSYVSLTFDQGMAWARPKYSCHGAVKHWQKPIFDRQREFQSNDTYVVRSTNISAIELDLLVQGYDAPDFVTTMSSNI
jgi:hypothetical protein